MLLERKCLANAIPLYRFCPNKPVTEITPFPCTIYTFSAAEIEVIRTARPERSKREQHP